MYMTNNILPVLSIKDLMKKYGNTTTPFKLTAGTKPSVSHLRALFCPCVVQKSTVHIGTKALKMRHQEQKGFQVIFVRSPQHQKGYLVYIPSTSKTISSYYIVFDERFFGTLKYTSKPYAEAIAMCLAVSCTAYATYSREKTGNIITFAKF